MKKYVTAQIMFYVAALINFFVYLFCKKRIFLLNGDVFLLSATVMLLVENKKTKEE